MIVIFSTSSTSSSPSIIFVSSIRVVILGLSFYLFSKLLEPINKFFLYDLYTFCVGYLNMHVFKQFFCFLQVLG